MDFTNAISSPICSTERVGRTSYPLERWISISFVTPIPWDMPGYDSQVIMAAGAFVSGASIELSADAPMKEPYAVYFQGGLTYPHAKFGIMMSLEKMVEKGLVVC